MRQEKQLCVHMAQDIGKTSFELHPDQDRLSGYVTRQAKYFNIHWCNLLRNGHVSHESLKSQLSPFLVVLWLFPVWKWLSPDCDPAVLGTTTDYSGDTLYYKPLFERIFLLFMFWTGFASSTVEKGWRTPVLKALTGCSCIWILVLPCCELFWGRHGCVLSSEPELLGTGWELCRLFFFFFS